MSNDENKNVICLASPLPKQILAQFNERNRPECPQLKWTAKRNLFISYQDFFRARKDIDIPKILKDLRSQILGKFFPLTIDPIELGLTPSGSTPKILEWRLGVRNIQASNRNVHEARKEMTDKVREVLKTGCLYYQSIEVDPSVILGRFTDQTPSQSDLTSLLEYQVPTDRFILDELMIVEATKDEFGTKYTYHQIEGLEKIN